MLAAKTSSGVIVSQSPNTEFHRGKDVEKVRWAISTTPSLEEKYCTPCGFPLPSVSELCALCDPCLGRFVYEISRLRVRCKGKGSRITVFCQETRGLPAILQNDPAKCWTEYDF